jgi:hypothetical protein
MVETTQKREDKMVQGSGEAEEEKKKKKRKRNPLFFAFGFQRDTAVFFFALIALVEHWMG